MDVKGYCADVKGCCVDVKGYCVDVKAKSNPYSQDLLEEISGLLWISNETRVSVRRVIHLRRVPNSRVPLP